MDAFLGLKPSESVASSHVDYATKLKSRLAYAYDVVSTEVRKNAGRHKTLYDLQIRHAALEPGDRVLFRKTGEKGTHKIDDEWEHNPYIVERQPIKEIPVYDVYKEKEASGKRRNMLLPFMGLPIEALCGKPKSSKKDDVGHVPDEPECSTTDDSTSSDSDESDSSFSEESRRCMITQRLRPGQQDNLQPRQELSGSTHAAKRPKQPIRRGTRARREPDRLQVGQMVNGVYEFSVPESMVVKL